MTDVLEPGELTPQTGRPKPRPVGLVDWRRVVGGTLGVALLVGAMVLLARSMHGGGMQAALALLLGLVVVPLVPLVASPHRSSGSCTGSCTTSR